MKRIFLYLSLFCAPILVAQTDKQKKLIVDSYNKQKVDSLHLIAKQKSIEQKILIDLYKKNNLNFDSTLSLQRVYDGDPIYFKSFNVGSSATIRANSMYQGGGLGLSLSGQGMLSGVWDGDKVRSTHQEFGNRLVINDSSIDAAAFGVHSTHVCGTIAAQGINPQVRGIAFGASILAHDWNDDYNEMVTFGNTGALVSNHSYGYAVNSNFARWRYGAYDASSIEIDQLSSTYPFYQIVIAAGNDRDDFSLQQVIDEGGYDLLTGTAVSKNSLVVAAVQNVTNYLDESSVIMSSFSNYGPTDDGRIKPDISAKGVGVLSASQATNFATATLNGTSMAAPAISGLILLLQKYYESLNPSVFMQASMVRGLICHSAREAGVFPGPDYEFGWGLADGRQAAEIISNKDVSTILEMNTLTSNQTFTKNIVLNSTQDIQFTICWTDPAGIANASGNTNNRTPRLVNNLDLKIINQGNIYYPYKLDPQATANPATNDSDNNVDNIEKVVIPNAEPGVYTIQVKHKSTLRGGSQEFALIANGSTGLTLSNNDFIYDDSVFVYPQPASSVLNFNVKSDIQIESVKINDISGKQVLSKIDNFNTQAIDISSLSAGVYFATFTSGKNSVVKKFIKN